MTDEKVQKPINRWDTFLTDKSDEEVKELAKEYISLFDLDYANLIVCDCGKRWIQTEESPGDVESLDVNGLLAIQYKVGNNDAIITVCNCGKPISLACMYNKTHDLYTATSDQIVKY